jgi:hypothetical protein
VRDYWLKLAKYPELVEHCLGFEVEDFQVRDEFSLADRSSGISPDGLTSFITTTRAATPSAIRNWNAAASISTAPILLGIADDLVPNQHWDEKIWELVSEKKSLPLLWKVSDSRCLTKKDSLFGDILPRHPLITRTLYDTYGFFFDPRYVTVGPDDEWLLLGLKNRFIRDARSIYLHHSVGPILNYSGELLCGCGVESPALVRTQSQELIHNSQWVQEARKNLHEWGLLWGVIASLSTSGDIADKILSISELADKEMNKPSFILLKLFRSKELTYMHRLQIVKIFLAQLFLR